jgi:hypothetical protein
VVSFDSRLSAEYRRTTSTSQFHKDPFESAISHHCDYVLEGIHRELWAWSDFGSFQAWRIPLILTHILSAALPRAVGNFLSDERAIAKCAEYSRSSDAQQFDPLFLVLGAFISAVAYEGWTVAFAMELLGGSEIEIEGIGKFHHMNLKSSFECDQNLLRLIEANLQGQAMAA